jgi:hypothetical protein
MEKNNDSSCSSLLGLLFLGVFVFQAFRYVISQVIKTFQYFENPSNVEQFTNTLKALGICFGSIFLAIVLLKLYFMIFPGKNKLRLITMSEEYPVRCILKETATQVPEESHELSGSKPTSPVYLILALTNCGVRLCPISENYAWDFIGVDNESRYRMLSDGRTGPMILAGGYSHVHYSEYHNKGDAHLESGVEKWGLLPDDPEQTHVEIVLVSDAILKEDDLTQVVRMDPQLKIKLVALDKKGQDDWAATRDLYNEIYKFMNPQLADDYSDPAYEGYNDPPPPWHY